MELLRLLALLMILLLSGLGLLALIALCGALWPGVVAETQQVVERRPVRSLFVGLINGCFFALVAAALGSAGGFLGLLGLLLLTVLLAAIVLGLTAIARLAGERLLPTAVPALLRLLVGALVLELAALTPIVGWFGVCLLACFTGYGALVLVLVGRWGRRHAPTQPSSAGS